MTTTLRSVFFLLLAGALFLSSAARAGTIEQELKALSEREFDATVEYTTKYRKACKTTTRFNRTKRKIAAFTTARNVTDIFEFKVSIEASRRDRLCADALLKNQGLFVSTMKVFEAAGCETNSNWGRSKCFNTGSCPATSTLSWSAAHERAKSRNQTQCLEFAHAAEQEWHAATP